MSKISVFSNMRSRDLSSESKDSSIYARVIQRRSATGGALTEAGNVGIFRITHISPISNRSGMITEKLRNGQF